MLNQKKQIILGIFFVTIIFGQIEGIGITLGGENSLMAFKMGDSHAVVPAVYVLIELDNGRLEPGFGFTNIIEGGNMLTITTLGIGYFFYGVENENISIYKGGRTSLINQIQSSENGGSAGNNAISLALVYGVEHSFSANFSMSGEVQLEYIKPPEDDFKTIQLNSLLFCRFYF